jgi:hypothetical protein
MAAVSDGREAERVVHAVLQQHRIGGNREFFALPVAVAQIIATICDCSDRKVKGTEIDLYQPRPVMV